MMTPADAPRFETLQALIAEKRRQETFLAKLEERRASAPAHVFNRLRDEYLTKLTDAQVKAAAEADALSAGLQNDDAALAEAEARLAALEEERIEVELRAEVEEWDATETEQRLTAMSAAIAMAEQGRDARRAAADRIRSLLTEARGDTPAPASAPAVVPAPQPALAPAPEPAPEPASAPSLMPLLHLELPTPTVRAVAASQEADEPKGAVDESLAESLFEPATSRTLPQSKTLKCAACASLNYPSEWYCERCGEELTAL
jgi:hypothetical protein